jgi:energy-coupling factor transporter transmembrane protein EcfT
MEREREYLHSWYVFIITAFSLLFLLINKNIFFNAGLIAFVLSIYLKNGLALRKMFRILSYAFVFSFGIFLLTVLNPSSADKNGTEYHLAHFVFYKISVDKALLTMMKLFLVSFLSISSASAIDYTKVILHLIVHKGLKLIWGYPFLLALNSITLFKEEYDRIKLNAHLRDLPLKDRLFVFFPLLVFAIRHSQRGALSLVTRGLSDKKTFYFSYDLSISDKKRLFLFFVFYFGLVVASQMALR